MLRATSLAFLFAAAFAVLAGFPGCASPSSRGAPSMWTGAWTLAGPDVSADLVLFENGQCVLVFPDRAPGRRGSRGFQRVRGGSALCIFEDGSALELARRGDLVVWAAGSPDDRRRRWQPATRVPSPQDGFVGLWRLNPEPTGDYLYVQLHADGSARNSLVASAGEWKLWKGGALCSWPGGWRDWLSPRDGGFANRSWPPGAALSSDPSDFSVALRVGDRPLSIAP